MKRLFFTILACIFLSPIFAQNGLNQLLKGERGLSKQLVLLSEKEQTAFDPAKARSIFGLDPNSDLVIMNTDTDKLGFTHYRYYQTYKDIPVENAMYIAHAKGGLLTAAGGAIITDFTLQASTRFAAALSAQQAVKAALQFEHAEKYAWEDTSFEQQHRQAKGSNATYYPAAEKVWYGGEAEIDPANLKLAYKIDVYSLKPFDRKYIFVDAQTGAVLGIKPLIMHADAPATVITGYSGPQTIHSDFDGSYYRLRDNYLGKHVVTLNGALSRDYTSTTANWSALSGRDRWALDAHYGVSATWTFYKEVMGRNSIDGNGYTLISYVNDPYVPAHNSGNPENAYWDKADKIMRYGYMVSNGNGITAIDITGHELTHGVTQFTSQLDYAGESGAINESISDIMGKSVQFYTKPNDINWQIGNDIPWIVRDMANPNAKKQPDTYMGTYWQSTTNSYDNYGVHTNSGVGNFMFYLLVTGGSGQNDLGNSYAVSGIGLDKAEQILYRSNTTYLSPFSKYLDWRTACIQSATDLYGTFSTEVMQVMNAWYAVGIGSSVINASQNVPYTTKPALLTGQDAPPGNKVFRWEYSYSGNDNDWHTVTGAEGQNFQPWDCWQTVYYRRVILWEYTNIWGKKYHDFYANSNVVKIIPYAVVTAGLYKIRNRNTGQVLEIGGGGSASITDGARANQWPAAGTANQEWNITATSTGVYKIINRNSGRALEVGGDPRTLTQQGAGVNQWPYWSGKNQQWLFQPVYGAPGYFTITNANSGQILEIGGGVSVNAKAGAYANQWPYAGEDFHEEHWELVPVTIPTSTRFPGVYTIKNVNSQKLLEIGGAATSNGATANQWSDMGTASQQWTLVDAGNGRYNIINRNSGLPLEIAKSSLAYTAQTDQWTMGSNSPNQQWTVEETTPGSGVYKIFNANSNQALEIAYGSTANGASATQYPYANVPHHHWILTWVSQNRVAASGSADAKQQLKAAPFPATGAGKQLEAGSGLSIYPNPASKVLNLNLPGAATLTYVKVSDMRGVVIPSVRYQGGGQLDISSLAAGVYLVTVSDGKRAYHQKFIKQ